MTMWRCTSCGGTYEDLGRDGVPYFHACAPRTHPIIRLRDGRETRLVDELPAEAVVVRTETEEQPDKRDENIRLDEQGHAMGIKAEGLGRTAVAS